MGKTTLRCSKHPPLPNSFLSVVLGACPFADEMAREGPGGIDSVVIVGLRRGGGGVSENSKSSNIRENFGPGVDVP